MIFSTYKFILCFLPCVLVLYWACARLKFYSLSKIILVVASFIFYAIGSPEFFPYFVMTVFANYIVGSVLSSLDNTKEKVQRKIIFILGILGNVALLGYYKYTDFFISNTNLLFGTNIPLQRIVLPIGISFFTFQLIAFLVDSYREQVKGYSVLEYLLFITFFPQLIVGPFIHHGEIIPQFNDENNLRFNWNNFATGIFLFTIGVAKKILIADPLTEDAELFFTSLDSVKAIPDFLSSWFYSFEYTISYYFDLSGYADMAIGLGWMFNVRIPENFDSPYKARNFQDYWQRWHKTLSRFLSDYIFRSVYRKNNKYRNYYVATMITFFVSGFWHGAGWTFVVWGIINGIFVCTASAMKRHNKSFPVFVSFPLTVIGVVCLRVLFVSKTFKTAWLTFKGMLNYKTLFGLPIFQQVKDLGHDNTIIVLPLILIASLICLFAPNSKSITENFRNGLEQKNTKTLASAFLIAVLFALCLMSMNKVAAFLYFQF